MAAVVGALGDHHQLGFLVAEGDPILPAVVLGEEENVAQVCKLVGS